MKVATAAESNLLAMPSLRWVEDTKRRGIPRGVGRAAGWQKSPALTSTGTKAVVDIFSCGVDDWSLSSEEAIFIAVEIRCAMRQPAIFSRFELWVGGRRNR